MVTAGLVLVVPTFDLLDKGTIGLHWGLAFALLTVANRRNGSSMNATQVASGRTLGWPRWWRRLPSPTWAAPAWQAATGSTWLSQFLFVKSLEGLEARKASAEQANTSRCAH
ncbi:hypothetical protein [Pseudomonas monteilii]|uniref:hypothetical protein n=1 Tax=Pseudomonas monteilii TaxID=76759 RepID=UPI003CFC13B9